MAPFSLTSMITGHVAHRLERIVPNVGRTEHPRNLWDLDLAQAPRNIQTAPRLGVFLLVGIRLSGDLRKQYQNLRPERHQIYTTSERDFRVEPTQVVLCAVTQGKDRLSPKASFSLPSRSSGVNSILDPSSHCTVARKILYLESYHWD